MTITGRIELITDSNMNRAIEFYTGLSIGQREGYAMHLANILKITVAEFKAAVGYGRERTVEPKQIQPARVTDPQSEKLKALAKRIENAFADLEIFGEVVKVAMGPRLVSVGFSTESKKFKQIIAEEKNLAHKLGMESVRIFSPFLVDTEDCKFYREHRTGSSLVGIEIPRDDPRTIAFSEIKMPDKQMELPLLLGLDMLGRPHVVALEDMPHILIGGSTNMGKSVLLHSLICGLLLHAKNFRIAMIDTKRVELSAYESNTGLLVDGDIARTKEAAAELLAKLEADMRWRYSVLEKAGARNISAFNAKSREKLAYLILIIDELADIFFGEKDTPIEDSLIKLAQMGRAVGIHIIAATQRPSVDVVNGLVKANFPARISLKLPSQVDSRTILAMPGAETLCGNGDMLFISPKHSGLLRLHAALITDNEIEKALQFYRPKEVYSLPGVRVERKTETPSNRAIQREFHVGFETAKKIKNRLKGIGRNEF